jgi:MerR HTH family regulatory protein
VRKLPLKESGKKYKFGEEEVILYPISKLVSELSKAGFPRNAQTIRKWENSGVTPKSIFRSGNKRLYSKEQIEAYCRVADECNIRQGYDISMAGFSERIWEELEEVNQQYRK